MRLISKNRNELSRYCYDLSKALIIACIAIPIIQGNLKIGLGIAFFIVSVILLISGLLLKKEEN